MKIESVKIENFRCFKNETILFDDYTCLIGGNGSGKSTVYAALNVFFRNNKDSKTDLINLTSDDFHHNNIDDSIKITVTFINLSEQGKADLADYVRFDKLIVTSEAVYNKDSGIATVKQFGNREGIKDFAVFFTMDKGGEKVADLKTYYLKLKEKYTDLPVPGTKQQMIEQLQEYEAKKPKLCTLLPSEDQFYGVSRGVNRLAPHIQWVFIPASQDIPEESQENKNSALGLLLSRTVRQKIKFDDKIKTLKDTARVQYEKILDQEQSTLDGISQSLEKTLKLWSHPKTSAKIQWKKESQTSIKIDEPTAFIQIGERDFDGELQRFGHGLQRSLMLALLQELNKIDDNNDSTLIMCIEEPEIYQHPPQIKFLYETLYELSKKSTQVMLCTHSPLFISSEEFENIRIVREKGNPSQSYVKQLTFVELSALLESAGGEAIKEEGMIPKLYSTLNPITNEMFFCNVLYLVEGVADLAYINSYLLLMDKLNEFRKNRCHIVNVGGKNNIMKPLAIAIKLNIPVFTIFDADSNQSDLSQQEKINKIILNLTNNSKIKPIPDDDIYESNVVMWKENIEKVIQKDFDSDWDKYLRIVNDKYCNPHNLGKNPIAISYLMEQSWNDGIKSVSLEKLIGSIIKFSESK